MTKKNATTTKKERPLDAIRDSLLVAADAIRDERGELPDDLQTLLDEMLNYHDVLRSREISLRGAVTSLVDDMSETHQALTETGNRLSGILEAAEDVAFIIVDETKPGRPISEFSKGAVNIFGYTEDEAKTLGVEKLCPREGDTCGDKGEHECGLMVKTNSRKLFQRKSGEIFPALHSVYPLHSPLGEKSATLVIAMDNTKREQAESLLHESYEKYKTLALASPISIMAFDENGVVTFVNDWHIQNFYKGQAAIEQYLGKKIYELPGLQRAGLAGRLKPVLEGKTISLDDVHVPAFGAREESWQSIRCAPHVEGDSVKGGVLIREDVTRRRRTERELKQLIDNSPIAIMKLELDEVGESILTYLNPAAVTMLGRGAVGKPVSNFITPLEEAAATLPGLQGEPCEVSTVSGLRQAIRTAHKPSDRLEIQAVMDVSELILAKQAAEDASRAKSDFLANISHEIRTPLNILLGMLQLFQDEELGEELDMMVEQALGAANSLLALLNDILDFSVVEARAMTLDEQDLDLGQIMKIVATPYETEAAQKGLEFHWKLNDSIPKKLVGDARRLRQILFHLIGNGVKFTDTGSVRAEGSLLARDVSKGRCHLLFTVTDTGIGISDTQLKTIFEPFRQGDGSRTRRHGGTGIGLSLVSEFVRTMNGTIAVDTEEGVGTRFTFTVELGLGQD